MKKSITLNLPDTTVASILQTAAIQLAERTHNKKHAAKLRRIAMDLDNAPGTVGPLDIVGGFLLQVAARQLANTTSNAGHAVILHNIARDINEKIHDDNQ